MKKRMQALVSAVILLLFCGCATPVEEQKLPVAGNVMTEVEANNGTEQGESADKEEGKQEEQNKEEESEDKSGAEQESNPDAEQKTEQEPEQKEPVHIHNYVDAVTVEAGCGTEGVLTSTCSECGDTKTKTIPVTGEHVWNEGTVVAEASCIAEGTISFTCTVCDNTKEEKLPCSEDHVWEDGNVTKEPTCAEEGEKTLLCALCKETKTELLSKTDAHTWDKGKVTKQPTCRTDGTKTFTCTLCSATKKQSVKSTGEHKWDEGFVEVKPSCSMVGKRAYTCTACGIVKREEIPTNDEHNWDRGKATVQPTRTTGGIYTYTCYSCDKTKSEEIGTYDFDVNDYGNPYHLRTSNSPYDYWDLKIEGDQLIFSGRIVQGDIHKVEVIVDWEKIEVELAQDGTYSGTLSLAGVTEKTKLYLTGYGTGSNYSDYIWSVIWLDYKNGQCSFVSSMVLEHNKEQMSHWVNPEKGRNGKVSESIVQLSNDIVGNETDDYKKLYLLNCWVAENIYYDYDYNNGKSKKLFSSAEDVYANRRTVCAGYANLLQKLIQAQGIPCVQVRTYSTGVGTTGKFDETNYKTTSSNHAHVEAFIEDRWVIMDPTWDSPNRYSDGEFVKGKLQIEYFDSNLDYFSFQHRILKRE